MKHLLSTTALVSVLAFAVPALAGDVVLNGQFNFGSPTEAVGVDVGGMIVKVDVTNLDVTAIGNLNETNINGGVDTFDLVKTSTYSSSSSRSKTYSSTSKGFSFQVSYKSSAKISIKDGKFKDSTKVSLSASGSAWNDTDSSSYSSASRSASSHSFEIHKSYQNSVFVGSLQVNKSSGTTAVGVDAGGKYVSVGVRNLTVQAVGNANLTNANVGN